MSKANEQHIKFAVLATDIVTFSVQSGDLMVLLMPINRPPHFTNIDGFPGGLILPNETAEESAATQLRDKVKVDPKKIFLKQLQTFSAIDRDPRGRVVSVAYLGLVYDLKLPDPEVAKWCKYSDLQPLAYDHDYMKGVARVGLKNFVTNTNGIKFLLPKTFTLSQLQEAYEIVLDIQIDKRNFRKKIKANEMVAGTGQMQSSGAHRPAELFKFSNEQLELNPLF